MGKLVKFQGQIVKTADQIWKMIRWIVFYFALKMNETHIQKHYLFLGTHGQIYHAYILQRNSVFRLLFINLYLFYF
jgi:hypothetical protein